MRLKITWLGFAWQQHFALQVGRVKKQPKEKLIYSNVYGSLCVNASVKQFKKKLAQGLKDSHSI